MKLKLLQGETLFQYLEQRGSFSDEELEAMRAVAAVLPFRTNPYYLDLVRDWQHPWSDPIARFVLPHPDMLSPMHLERMRRVLARRDATRAEVHLVANTIRYELNPHPAGQVELNVPRLNGQALHGLQHKYPETVLVFPSWGQQCATYCGYCFRWAQFVNIDKFELTPSELKLMVSYLQLHPEATDVLFTGGDPLFGRTSRLRSYVMPLLRLDTVRSIRFGTKMPVHWPFRFLPTREEGNEDEAQRRDAEALLRLFETIHKAGKHVAVMLHSTHPIELSTEPARRAIERILNTGAVIRTQSPIVRHVNDDPNIWAAKWQLEVEMGMVPYYMFVERDTGARHYWEIPLARVHRIFSDAIRQVSGLARTVRGPSMSATPGKVRIVGVQEIRHEKVFVLEFLQARNPSWVGRPFFAKFDPQATWFDQLVPALGRERFFFEVPSRHQQAQAS